MTIKATLTTIGAAKVAASLAPGGASFDPTHIAFTSVAPATPLDPSATVLAGEVHRRALDAIYRAPSNPARLVFEAVIPPEIGGWVMRGYAIFDNAGDMVAYGSTSDTNKPAGSGSEVRSLTFRTHIAVSPDANVSMSVDPNGYATKNWVLEQFRRDRPYRYYRNGA